jgi:hypothetical protein
MKKSQLRNIIRESIKELMNEQTSCDNSMAGSCAQTHLPPNMNWPNMTNFACTGTHTFSGLFTNNMTQVQNLINIYSPNASTGGSNNPVDLAAGVLFQFLFAGYLHSWSSLQSGINTYASTVGMTREHRGQMKRKIAKAIWAQCMIQQCNC